MREGYALTRLQKIPIIGDHFVKEIPPSDNVRPFLLLSSLGVFSYFLDHSSPAFLADLDQICLFNAVLV